MTTELMRPALLDGHYALRGEVVRLTRQIAYAEATISSDEGKLVSRATGTFLVHRDEARLDVVGRDLAESSGLVVLEGLLEFGARVHHEGSVGRDGLADGLAAEDEDLERLRCASPGSRWRARTRKSPSTCTAIWPIVERRRARGRRCPDRRARRSARCSPASTAASAGARQQRDVHDARSACA